MNSIFQKYNQEQFEDRYNNYTQNTFTNNKPIEYMSEDDSTDSQMSEDNSCDDEMSEDEICEIRDVVDRNSNANNFSIETSEDILISRNNLYSMFQFRFAISKYSKVSEEILIKCLYRAQSD